MIDAIFAQPNYVAAKKLLDATALRHEAIASNLANIETPNYRRIDLDPSFVKELNQAMGTQDSAQLNALQPKISVDANAVSARRDGNTVELDSELLNLNENNLNHALDTQLVSSSLIRLRMAITGRSTA